MFTYIKLKNFESFKDVVFDFRKNKKDTKKFIAVYGENGSGKTNFVDSINFLIKSIDSFNMLQSEEYVMKFINSNNLPLEVAENILNDTNILRYVRNYRMIDCNKDTEIEYGFEINNHKGYYCLSFNDRFSYEKLYYYTGKQNVKLFEIKKDNDNEKINVYFSSKLFNNKKVEQELKEEISKYWGKHTFLSILNKELQEKNEQYITKNYLMYVFDIICMLHQTTLYEKKTHRLGSAIISGKPYNILENLKNGKISKEDESVLNRSERILKDFFTQAYSDIKDVFYDRTIEDGTIIYNLFVKKMIGGEIKTIGFSQESAGTQHVLNIIRILLGAFCGVTVVYDEIDDGIHDLLLRAIIESMIDDITGQLIITTHNTILLEEINVKSAYTINIDYKGNKEVRCLAEYPVQETNNPRNMYLKGLFGGVPFVDYIDYDEIIEALAETDENVWEDK